MNFKNFKLGFGIAAAGILIGGLIFSSIDKFETNIGVVPNTITNTLKTAEANMYKQFLDLSLMDYQNSNTSFKSHGQTNCFLENNVINCSIENVQFEYLTNEGETKQNTLSVDKVLINNVKDFKTKVELIYGKDIKTEAILKPDFKTNFSVIASNIKFNNKSQAESIISTIRNQSTGEYSLSDIELLNKFLSKNLDTLSIKLTDHSENKNNIINNQSEVTIYSNNLNIGASINVDLTSKFIELLSKKEVTKEDLLNMNEVDRAKAENDLNELSKLKMKEMVINNISLKLNNKEPHFIKELFEVSLITDSDKSLSNEELTQQLDLNFSEILKLVNNSKLEQTFKTQFKEKLIEVSQGKTSDITLSLDNLSNLDMNNTMSLFMQANILKDISLINRSFSLTIK